MFLYSTYPCLKWSTWHLGSLFLTLLLTVSLMGLSFAQSKPVKNNSKHTIVWFPDDNLENQGIRFSFSGTNYRRVGGDSRITFYNSDEYFRKWRYHENLGLRLPALDEPASHYDLLFQLDTKLGNTWSIGLGADHLKIDGIEGSSKVGGVLYPYKIKFGDAYTLEGLKIEFEKSILGFHQFRFNLYASLLTGPVFSKPVDFEGDIEREPLRGFREGKYTPVAWGGTATLGLSLKLMEELSFFADYSIHKSYGIRDLYLDKPGGPRQQNIGPKRIQVSGVTFSWGLSIRLFGFNNGWNARRKLMANTTHPQ